jgi:hypothetical protein
MMILLVCKSQKLQDSQIARPQASQYIAFFPSRKTCETHETCTGIFARSEFHFPTNFGEKNCETRLAVNPIQVPFSNVLTSQTSFLPRVLWEPPYHFPLVDSLFLFSSSIIFTQKFKIPMTWAEYIMAGERPAVHSALWSDTFIL